MGVILGHVELLVQLLYLGHPVTLVLWDQRALGILNEEGGN